VIENKRLCDIEKHKKGVEQVIDRKKEFLKKVIIFNS